MDAYRREAMAIIARWDWRISLMGRGTRHDAERWNHDRTKYIGGSDVAGILGISPWAPRLRFIWIRSSHVSNQ